MKARYASIGLVALSILFSCNTIDYDKLDRVRYAAVLSVNCSGGFDSNEFKGFPAFFSAALQAEKFDLRQVAADLEDELYSSYAKRLPFKLLPKKEVLGTRAYRRYSEDDSGSGFLYGLAPGYSYVPAYDSRAFRDILEGIEDADAGLVIEVSYRLQKATPEIIKGLGLGLLKVSANLAFALKDRSGETIMRHNAWGDSDTMIPYVLDGVFDASEVRKMCEEATAEARREFFKWLREKL
jgi:hypothetical protein